MTTEVDRSKNTSSTVVEEIIKGPDGKSVRKTTTTTTTRTKSTDAQGEPVAQPGFIARVSSIPLVQDSVSTLSTIANDNKYSRYALDTAGNAVGAVSKYTEGYQKSLQPHITKVDQFAAKSIDVLEATFPIVTKPTAEIVTQVKKPIVFVEESSKNAYTQIQSTIDTHVTTPVKAVTSNIATTAANTRNQVTTAATTTASTVAAAVNTRATPLVDGFEAVVNRILPDGEIEPSTQTNQAARVVDLTRNASLRVSRRVSVSVAPLTQSAQDLRKSAESNATFVKSKESIQALNVRLTTLLESVRLHAKELQDNVQKVPGEATQRIQTLNSSLLAEIDSLSVYLKEHSPKLPEYVQVRLEPLATFVNDRYVVVKGEIVKPDVSALQKARNILHLTTEETLPILQNAAQDVKESLAQYQVTIQEKVHEVNTSVSDAATRAVNSARSIVSSK
ncbi:hypothetical protein BGZ76_001154 [Entomortierella beljakovae]|nr:hypothetical protein BGZ76_001154 [Entomortierella beljakovae]